jgi:hypothetical protein
VRRMLGALVGVATEVFPVQLVPTAIAGRAFL